MLFVGLVVMALTRLILSGLTDGPITASISTTDTAGNTATGTGHTATKDTIAPGAPTVALTMDSGVSGSDHNTNVGTLNVTGVEAGALVEYSINRSSSWNSSFHTVSGRRMMYWSAGPIFFRQYSNATTLPFTLKFSWCHWLAVYVS